ncbi:MAG: NlpC/P60 family protein [Traorella sp.]
MDHKNYLSNNISLQQLMKITGSVSLVTLLAFSQRGILQAQEALVPTTNRINLEPIQIDYNDTKSIAELSKTILKDQVSTISQPRLIESSQTKDVYTIGDYIVSIYFDKNSGLGLKDVKMTIETNFTYHRNDDQKIYLADDQQKTEFIDGIVNEYSVKVFVQDNVKPVIQLSKTSITIESSDSFNIKDYIKSVTDNVDGNIKYNVSGSIDSENGEYKPGTYKFVISAKDSSGNSTSKTFTVKVKEPKKVTTSYYGNSVDTSGYKGASYIVNAAYAQLGEAQDCTRLVSDSLAAAGIYFHGWPIEYFALGYEVSYSQAKPGDLIYYANGGGGLAHIAVYVGNGMSIHGGWHGSTVLYSCFYSTASTPHFIRITK